MSARAGTVGRMLATADALASRAIDLDARECKAVRRAARRAAAAGVVLGARELLAVAGRAAYPPPDEFGRASYDARRRVVGLSHGQALEVLRSILRGEGSTVGYSAEVETIWFPR